MIHCELISQTLLNEKFHSFCEQITGVNPASIVQSGRRPRSRMAYPLAYFKAFVNPNSDTSDVQALLGLLQFGMLCAGPEISMAEVTGWPHGLRCLQGPPSRRGLSGVIIIGDGDQWATAIRNAGDGPQSVVAWGQSCYNQFSKYDLADLMGRMRKRNDGGYFLESI